MASRNLNPVVTCGHPDRSHAGRGMCRACYTKDWINKRPELKKQKKAAWYKRSRARLAADPEKLAKAREKGRAQAARWRKENPEKYRETTKRANHKKYHSERGFLIHRNSWLKRKFGITLIQYEEMLAAQNELCAICGQPENVNRRRRKQDLCVDHDHETGKVRGLLCQRCNCMIGYARDDAKILEAAVAYLARANGTLF